MSNIVAAGGVGQLDFLDEIVARKRRIFGWYRERLADVPGVAFMPEAAYGRCSRWLTVLKVRREGGRTPNVERRTPDAEQGSGSWAQPSETVMRLIGALERENVESRPVWKPMHLQPVFRGARTFGGGIGGRLFAEGLCLPSGAGLAEEDVAFVSARVRKELMG
jgi:dTDP-4-amino-4,6-dideoxygalactose transaminase